MTELRKGITTGSCAAAAAKAAVIYLVSNTKNSVVEITLPSGEKLAVAITKLERAANKVHAYVIKDAGDDPDVTNGAEVVVSAEWADSYELAAGVGVGRVTKPGLAITPGEYAINPVPRKMIHQAVHEVLPEGNVKITVSVPQGEELAKRTLNPKLGIVGGISILGTTGIVEPMSEEAYKTSLIPQIDIAKAQGYKENIIFVPGKMGERSVMRHLNAVEEEIAQSSNFIGYMLEKAVQRGFKRILLWGHVAKLIKVAAGNMHTHNRVSDARFETLAAHAAVLGGGDIAPALMSCNTTEEAVEILEKNNLLDVLYQSAESARKRAQDFLFGDAQVAVVFTKLNGDVLACSGNLEELMEEAGWQKKFMW